MGLHDDEDLRENECHLLFCRHDDDHRAHRVNDHEYDRVFHGGHGYDHDRGCGCLGAHDLLGGREILYVLVWLAQQGHLGAIFQQMKQISNDFSWLEIPQSKLSQSRFYSMIQTCFEVTLMDC